MRYKVFCGFLMMALGNTGYAGVKEGIKAFESRLDSIAIQELLPLAVKGDAEAQYYIGKMYWAGREFTQNKIFMIMDNDFGLAELENHQFKIDPTQTPRLIWFELGAQKAKKGK